MQQTAATATATFSPESKGTFRTCFTIHPAQAPVGALAPAWLNVQRDHSILHYGEFVKICMAPPMSHLVLKAERATAKGQQAPHFAHPSGSDCTWQVQCASYQLNL